MELEFSKHSISHLKCVLQDVFYSEETAETIVPDSAPDMETIIASYADVILRGKECHNGSISISGGIKGSILYRTEHSAPKALQLYIPFAIKAENKSLTEQSKLICSVKVRSVDGRMLNSRKAMLRVNISCSVMAFEPCEETVFELHNKPSSLQTKESTYKICCPAEYAEKAFSITEELDTVSQIRGAVHLVRDNCRIEIIEKKLVGNKAVFKGIAYYKMLLLSESGILDSIEQQLPFSQYCEFTNDYDDQPLEFTVCITSCDLDLTDGEEKNAHLTLHILVQGLVFDTHTLAFIDDAYCIGKSFEPQWSKISIYSRLDAQKDRQQLRCRLQGDLTDVIDVTLYEDHPTLEALPAHIAVQHPVSVQVLGIDTEGEMICLQGKTQHKQNYCLSDNGRCNATSNLIGTCSASIYSGGIETCTELCCENTFMTQQDLICLSGGEIKDLPRTETDRPAVILKRLPKGTSLWDIAKETHSKVESIREANHLQEQCLTEDKMLLIPVG